MKFLYCILFCLASSINSYGQEADKTLIKVFNPQECPNVKIDIRNKDINSEPWDEGMIRIQLEVKANVPAPVLAAFVKAGRYSLDGAKDGETYIVSAPNLNKAIIVGGKDLEEEIKIKVQTPGYFALADNGILSKEINEETIAARSNNQEEAAAMVKKMKAIRENVELQVNIVSTSRYTGDVDLSKYKLVVDGRETTADNLSFTTQQKDTTGQWLANYIKNKNTVLDPSESYVLNFDFKYQNMNISYSDGKTVELELDVKSSLGLNDFDLLKNGGRFNLVGTLVGDTLLIKAPNLKDIRKQYPKIKEEVCLNLKVPKIWSTVDFKKNLNHSMIGLLFNKLSPNDLIYLTKALKEKTIKFPSKIKYSQVDVEEVISYKFTPEIEGVNVEVVKNETDAFAMLVKVKSNVPIEILNLLKDKERYRLTGQIVDNYFRINAPQIKEIVTIGEQNLIEEVALTIKIPKSWNLTDFYDKLDESKISQIIKGEAVEITNITESEQKINSKLSYSFSELEEVINVKVDSIKIKESVGKNCTNNSADVKIIQSLFCLKDDGNCNAKTIRLIKRFQKKNGLSDVNGKVELHSETWEKIKALISSNKSLKKSVGENQPNLKEDVELIQEFLCLKVDGICSKKTIRAIKRFQKSNSQKTTNGIVRFDDVTWMVLSRNKIHKKNKLSANPSLNEIKALYGVVKINGKAISRDIQK